MTDALYEAACKKLKATITTEKEDIKVSPVKRKEAKTKQVAEAKAKKAADAKKAKADKAKAVAEAKAKKAADAKKAKG